MVDNIPDEQLIKTAEHLYDRTLAKSKEERDAQQADLAVIYAGSPDAPEVMSDDEIKEQLEWLVPAFKDFLSPHPRDFDDPIEKLGGIQTAFGGSDQHLENGELGMIAVAKDNMSKWEGDLATNFVENFAMPLEKIAVNQGKVVGWLQLHLQYMKSIYQRGRQDAEDIAKQGTEAIDAISDSRGAESLTVLLAAWIAAGTVAGPVLGALKAAIGVQLLNASVVGGAVMAGPFTKDGPPLPMGADTVQEVMDNVRSALQEARKRITEDEKKLTEVIEKNFALILPSVLNVPADSTALVPMEPGIASVKADSISDGLFIDGPGKPIGGSG